MLNQILFILPGSDDLFTARSNLVTCFSIVKKENVDFSETIAASGLKFVRCRQLIELMKVYAYSRSSSYLLVETL